MNLYKDKIEHFICSSAIVFVINYLLHFFLSLNISLIIACAFALFFGMFKEWTDKIFFDREVDYYDLLCDIGGIIMAVLVIRI